MNPTDCKDCGVLKAQIQDHKESLDKLSEVDKNQWNSIANRPKTSTLIKFIGIGYIVIALVVGTGYTLNADDVSDLKQDMADHKKEQTKQFRSLEGKVEKIKDSVHEINLDIKEIKVLLRKDR